jgi:hypothetical protein
MEPAKQLKLQPADMELLAPSEYRYYIVQTLESDEGRSMSLLSKCDREGEARQAAADLFLQVKDRYLGITFGIGIVDTERPDYMLSYRFVLGKQSKK